MKKVFQVVWPAEANSRGEKPLVHLSGGVVQPIRTREQQKPPLKGGQEQAIRAWLCGRTADTERTDRREARLRGMEGV